MTLNSTAIKVKTGINRIGIGLFGVPVKPPKFSSNPPTISVDTGTVGSGLGKAIAAPVPQHFTSPTAVTKAIFQNPVYKRYY